MRIFAFLEPFFHALNDGKLIRLTVAWVLRVLAVISALIGLFGFIAILGLGYKATDEGLVNRSAGLLIACVLLALFALAWGYLTAGIYTFRARSVQELGDSHFTVLSILSILFRLNGEVMFATYSMIGVGGCLFVWFADMSPFSQLGALVEMLPFAAHESAGFLGGIEFAVLFLLIAFMGIVFSYALAELTVVWVEIALNTRGLRTSPEAVGQSPIPASTALTPVPAPPVRVEQPPIPAQRECGKCGQPLDRGATFCGECGAQVS